MFDTMNSPNRNIAIVRAVRDQGGTPTGVAKRFGISRQRVHQILNAYDAGGAEAIAPKSRAPHTHPHAVPEALRNDIISIHKQLTRHGLDAGAETIAYHLEQAGKRAAAIMSLLATAKANGIDPHAWLTDTLARLPTTLDRDIDTLLPLRQD